MSGSWYYKPIVSNSLQFLAPGILTWFEYTIAQGIALGGKITQNLKALKGRHKKEHNKREIDRTAKRQKQAPRTVWSITFHCRLHHGHNSRPYRRGQVLPSLQHPSQIRVSLPQKRQATRQVVSAAFAKGLIFKPLETPVDGFLNRRHQARVLPDVLEL